MKWKSSEKIHVVLDGPGDQVSCEYTEELESLSVKGYPVEVLYGPANEEAKVSHGRITDFVTRDRIEYMLMSDGAEIRLNQIRSIKSV
ncbi:hypothetical protein D3C72_1849940 [compost metagenome]